MRKRVLKATLRDRFRCGGKHSKLNSVFLQTDGADRMLVEQPFIESVFGSSLFFDLHGGFSRVSGKAPASANTIS